MCLCVCACVCVNPKFVVANEFRVLINECVGHTHTHTPRNSRRRLYASVNPKLVVTDKFRVLFNECVGHTHTHTHTHQETHDDVYMRVCVCMCVHVAKNFFPDEAKSHRETFAGKVLEIATKKRWPEDANSHRETVPLENIVCCCMLQRVAECCSVMRCMTATAEII